MFEYLMPLLVMRSFPETLLDESCRMAVRRQIDYAATRGTPWGISESAYTAVDRLGNYQYKAFGVPGLGLKRGLGDELVVSPYATALAVLIDPARSARNLRRLADIGMLGELGFYESIDYTDRGGGRHQRPNDGVIVRAYFAHHAGMTLVALANAVTGDRMIERFHADPRVRATELLLQERVPRQQPITEPRPLDETLVTPQGLSVPFRRYRTPHTVFPHTQFLSNGKYTRRRSPTPAAAPASTIGCASRARDAMPRSIRAATSSTCATSAAARCGRRRYHPDAARGRALHRHVPARTWRPSIARARRSPRGWRSRSRRSTTSRCASCSSSTTAIACARSTSPATSRWRWRRRATISRIPRSASCSSKPSSSPNAAR